MLRITPHRIIIGSFFTIIILGALLLQLPQAAKGPPIRLVDALFTATSATCVTGLVVVDTGSRFSVFGQLVILFLIQVGGLGIMTFSTFFIFLITHRFSVRGREITQQTLGQQPIRNLSAVLASVFGMTIAIEAVGSLVLFLAFYGQYSALKAAYLALFHAISAFCNAGFSLFPDSFVSYKGNAHVILTIILLIILGGLGFLVLFDLFTGMGSKALRRQFRLSFHSRLVCLATFYLIGLGALGFFVLELHNSLQPLSLPTKVLCSLFHSVTARTAGFNTLDLKPMTNSTLLLLILLMFIGASPGSTGGGVKTTTFLVLLSLIVMQFRGQEEISLFYRRIPKPIISKAIAIVAFSITIVILFTMALLVTEQGGMPHHESRGLFLEIFFEVVSAFGTVGLSTGITPTLTTMGKLLIIGLMFIGRVGPLSVAIAVGGEKKSKANFYYPEENILVG
ncbi:MAG: TrkH family potassium uptake protein [candidate division KSB1 bacterium]|nr:TrkH family potassium uptake protein [candidate division KSB1 bacterium]